MPNFSLSKFILALAIVVTFFIGGIAGLVSVVIVLTILYFLGGLDSETKHGISENQSCRLGGVILVVYPACAAAFQWFVNGETMFTETGWLLMAICLGFFVLGLFEDLTSALSARLRLGLMLLGSIVLVLLVPDLLIQPVDVPGVDWVLTFSVLAYPFTVLTLTFVPNAFNIADGANGLVSGISLLAIYGLMSAMPDVQVWSLEMFFIGCLIFFCLNVLTGRLFLGDGGAYLLGSIVGISLILTLNRTDISPWFLGMLIFYPKADFIFSILRRTLAGRSAMSADNLHFHNLMFAVLKRMKLSAQMANTLTGISIALLWTGSAIYLESSTKSDINWMLIYVLSWMLFVALWFIMRAASAKWSLEKPSPA